MTAGVEGYERDVARFVASSQQLNFHETNRAFLPFLTAAPAAVLDAGAGAGQNAAALAKLGHRVTAVEPMADFLAAAKATYRDLPVDWRGDSLPQLASLEGSPPFDFVLADGVWHHLSDAERGSAFVRLAALMNPGGRLAISLRNGPAGMGVRVFPTDVERTLAQAAEPGLRCVFRLENQPSLFAHKPDVRWARVVFEKPAQAFR